MLFFSHLRLMHDLCTQAAFTECSDRINKAFCNKFVDISTYGILHIYTRGSVTRGVSLLTCTCTRGYNYNTHGYCIFFHSHSKSTMIDNYRFEEIYYYLSHKKVPASCRVCSSMLVKMVDVYSTYVTYVVMPATQKDYTRSRQTTLILKVLSTCSRISMLVSSGISSVSSDSGTYLDKIIPIVQK